MAAPMEIRIVEYQTRWVQEFETIARVLHDAVGGLALRINHIRSTSVPGLAAKDVIDVQVTTQWRIEHYSEMARFERSTHLE